MGTEGENLVRKCKQRLKRCLKHNVYIRITYGTKKIAMFCSNKDKTPDALKSHCVYEFKCPGCSKGYIGKTDRNFLTRTEEHGTHSKDQDTVVYKHLQSCAHFHDILSIYNINISRINDRTNIAQHIFHAATDNTKIVAMNDHWDQLCFLESLHTRH